MKHILRAYANGSWIQKPQPHDFVYHLRNDNVIQSIGIKTVIVEAILEGTVNQICITFMMYVPELHASLLLVRKSVSNDLKIQFNPNECIVKCCDGLHQFSF